MNIRGACWVEVICLESEHAHMEGREEDKWPNKEEARVGVVW